MINAKRLIEMVRKPQKSEVGQEACSTSSSVASKGHLFVYAIDGKRFMIPLEYITSNIFQELFKMSEEEFGLPSDGPIILPCDATCMEYIISLIRCRASKDVERALLTTIANGRCTVPLPTYGRNEHQHQLIVYGF